MGSGDCEGREGGAGRNCQSLGQEGLRRGWKDHLALGVGLGSRGVLGSDKGTEI